MKILIIDEMHPSLMPMLVQKGFEPDYQPTISRKQVLEIINNYEGIVVRSKLKLDKVFFERATKLKLVARAGAGLDQIDIEQAEKRHIHLLNAPQGNRDAVGEHTVGMLLCLFNKLHLADRQVRNYVWDREANRGLELYGKSVGIMGYGNMGKAFARRLVGFGCQVLAYDVEKEKVDDFWVMKASIEDIFREADIFSLHIPLTPENKAIFTEDFFQNFRKDIFLVNTARGELIDFQLLKKLLDSGKVRGACLDVLENEKLNTLTPPQKESFEYLIQSEKVLFSPHVAGWTVESYLRINEVLVEKMSRVK
jgi:D-3-phosphoglycerate dehydrogenase / 2-oxoglutarate reductase